MLIDHLELVRQRIHRACQRGGRDPSSVTLVCVTKGLPVETIQQAVALGVSDLGENRVQEAHEKRQTLDVRPGSLRWHLIGHLQRNKAKAAVELFDVIHSLDSLSLLEELERQAVKRARRTQVLVQVNVSGEPTKSGCPPEEATTLARAVMNTAHLTLTGFMTIAPFADDPETVRPVFRQLRGLRDEAAAALSLPPAALRLSMGMSQDFEVAIEEGADIVRIGTAIFGERTTAA